MNLSPLDRFFRHVAPNGACWEWTATRSAPGYGQFRSPEGPLVGAHRWLYEQLIAEIPAGLHLDHLCRNPRCVNVYEHLEPVTPAVNAHRASAVVTHCKQGHPLGAATAGVRRICRTCQRAKPWPIRSERCDGVRTTNYQYGCRCALCRRASSVMQAQTRMRRKQRQVAA